MQLARSEFYVAYEKLDSTTRLEEITQTTRNTTTTSKRNPAAQGCQLSFSLGTLLNLAFSNTVGSENYWMTGLHFQVRLALNCIRWYWTLKLAIFDILPYYTPFWTFLCFLFLLPSSDVTYRYMHFRTVCIAQTASVSSLYRIMLIFCTQFFITMSISSRFGQLAFFGVGWHYN